MASSKLHAVVLAGGAGERFWPASRRARPKPFLEVVGGKTLLEATLARARRFAGDRVWIVCGKEHASAVRRESGLPRNRVLVEPERRNTSMAVAWAATCLACEEPEALMAVLPADHHIPDAAAFAKEIRRGARAAQAAGALVTLGIEPTRPDTGYGYIQVGEAQQAFPGLVRARRFVEKPDAATARRYLRGGDHLWNAGIFVWSVRSILEEIERHVPALARALAPLRATSRCPRTGARLARAYAQAPSLPIDVAVMEKSDRVWTLPVDFAWSDVGTWESLAEELGIGIPRGSPGGKAGSPEETGNRVIAGDVLVHDARDNLVWGQQRLVALLGVEGLAVVDSGDVILVTRLDRSSDVRRLVESLKKARRFALT